MFVFLVHAEVGRNSKSAVEKTDISRVSFLGDGSNSGFRPPFVHLIFMSTIST